MKPKTKKERLLVGLAEKLPPMTKAQAEYPKSRLFPRIGYYWKKGVVWCQCCGTEYLKHHNSLAISIEIGSDVCPCCGANLKLQHAGNRLRHEDAFITFTIATTFMGFQVFRTFFCQRSNTRGSKAKYTIDEVFQNWVDEHGFETITKREYSRSPFHLKWNYNSSYSIGRHTTYVGGYYSYSDIFDVSSNYFYPRTSVLPIIKRNGWDNAFLNLNGVNPVDLMRSLLSNPEIETLAKTGQHRILQHYMRHGWYQQRCGKNFKRSEYFDSVCICNRNHYIVEDAGLWYDLLRALDYLGLDTHNAHYVCPPNLKAAHDRYIKRAERARAEEERRKQREEAAQHEEEYRLKKGCYLGVCFGNEHFRVTVLQSVAEFVEEGEAMHHCVYANEYFASDCLILSVRDNDNKRLATAEVSLKDFKVLQCRAKCNAKPKHYDEMVKLINSHAKDFRKARAKAKSKAKKEVA